MRLATSALLLAGLVGAPALAQTDHKGAPSHQPEAPRAPMSAEEAKKHLQRRLDDLEKQQAALREAMQKIDAGAPVSETMRAAEPRRRPPGTPGPERLDRQVTQEERDHAHAFLRKHLPALADRFDAFAKANPEWAERGLRRMVPRVQEAEELETHDPRLFKLKLAELEGQVAVVDAIRAYREAEQSKDPARLAAATATLRAALARQLDTRLQQQAHEVESLTHRLGELRADLDKKSADKSAEVERTLKRIQEYPQRSRDQQREGAPREKSQR